MRPSLLFTLFATFALAACGGASTATDDASSPADASSDGARPVVDGAAVDAAADGDGGILGGGDGAFGADGAPGVDGPGGSDGGAAVDGAGGLDGGAFDLAPSMSWLDVDDSTPWKTCGSCANSGATGPTAYTELDVVTAPSEDGHSIEVDVGETPSGAYENHPPYGDAYWWREHGKLPSLVAQADYQLDVYVPSTNHEGQATAPQAIELELQQTRSNVVYNLAWQDDYSSNQWRVFQYGGAGNGKWLPSGITGADFPSGTTKLAEGQWHHLHAHYSIDASTSPATIRHDWLEVDGVRHPSTVTVTAWPVPTTQPARADQFSNAVQLDMDAVACTQGSSTSCQQTASGAWKEGTPYHVYWDKLDVAVYY